MKYISRILVFLLFLSPLFMIQSVGNIDDTILLSESIDITTTSESGWLSGWEYRKSHVVTGSLGAGTGYQIQINVHRNVGVDSGQEVYCGGHCRTDFGDIRFTSSDGVTLLDYWLENRDASINASFWVEVTDNLDTDQIIYLYYGNDDAVDASDGDSTFVHFDDFENDLSDWSTNDTGAGDIWEITTAPSGRTGNAAHYEEGGTGGSGQVVYTTFPETFSMTAHLMFHWNTIDGQFRGNFLDKDDWHPATTFTSTIAESWDWQYYDTEFNWFDFEDGLRPFEDTWYELEWDLSPQGKSNMTIDGVTYPGENTYESSSSGFDMFRFYGHANYQDDFYIDDFYIRKSIYLEPSHGIWGELESEPPNGEDWLPTFEFRKEHNIFGSVGAGTNYQIEIIVHYGSGSDSGNEVYCSEYCKSNFSDIRFTDNDGVTLLDYWMESYHDTDNATFWIEVADNLDFDQAIYVYYGNPDAIDAGDGESTFIVWDDFDLGYSVGDAPKSSRGWFISDNGTGDLLEISPNPTGRGGNGLRYMNVETIESGMMLENDWSQVLSVALHMKLYWDVRAGQFRYDLRDIDDDDSSVSTWSNAVSSYNLQYRDSPTTHLSYSPTYELHEDTWYNIESQCEFDTHSLIVNNTTLSGDVRTSGDGYDHIYIYGHEDYLDDFYLDDFFIRKFVFLEPSHGGWSNIDSALSISSPYSITYEGGSTGNTVLWSALSYQPDRYILMFDGVLQINSTWDGADVEISSDGLDLGTHNYTLEIFNTFGDSLLKRTYVRVVDTTDPILSQPDGVNYTIGSQGNLIEWTLNDLYPDSYELYFGNETLSSGTWNSTSNQVSISVDGLPVGVHNYTLYANDTSGNIASDIVTVTVTVPSIAQIDSVIIIIMIAGVVVIIIIGGIVYRKKKK